MSNKKKGFHFKAGECIRKNSNELFGSGIKAKPVIKIGFIKSGRGPGRYIVNGKFDISATSVRVVEESEMWALNDLFKNLSLSETNTENINTSHYRNDNGEPKKAFASEQQARYALYYMIMKNPGVRYQMYKCSFCSEIHLGRDITQLQEQE